MMPELLRDVVYSLRVLRKSPGFTVAVALSLGLGIGANTAIFTLMDAVMWRMLPVSEPERLLVAGRQFGQTIANGFNYSDFKAMRGNSTLVDIAGYTTAPINVSVDGPPEPTIQGQLVSGNYFGLLGVPAVLGRTIGAEDDNAPNGHPVAMLSHGYWGRRFASDPSVIGRTVRLSGTPFTIVGVTPPEFFGVEIGVAPDLFLPIMMQPTVMPSFENLLQDPIVNRQWVRTIARTRPGVSLEQGAAALDAIVQGNNPPSPQRPGLRPSAPARLVLTHATAVSDLRRQFSRPLFVLLAMVGVVLLIACANTANLLLARAAARRSEFAMRLALGAGRPRLLRQLLAESVVLAALGGICGIVLAGWATRLLVLYMSSGRTPIALNLEPNLRILAFTAGVSLLTGLFFGIAPAWKATRIDLSPALKNVRGSLTRTLRPGRTLAVVQLALTMLLLVGAGLFVRSLQKLSGDDGRSLRQSVIVLRVEPRGSDQRGIPGTTERLDRTYRELMRRTREIPQVSSVGMANAIPTAPETSAGAQVRTPSGDVVRVPMLSLYPGYFETIGIPLVSGRDFAPNDIDLRAPAVCIVNESFVRQFLPGEDPIGKPCYTGRRHRLASLSDQTGANEPFTIVGVVKDSRYSNPRGEVRPLVYLTFLQANTGRGQMVLHVRSRGNTGQVVQRIREEVAAVDPTMPMFDVHTLEEEMNAALVQQRLIAMLSSCFGALSLILACVGLYGLLAFTLVQRRNEMGIRLALGARPIDLVVLVVSEAMILVAIGLAIGLPAALAVARLASSQIAGLVFGLRATDPVTIAAAAAVMSAVAALAAYLPARRASKVDPMLALRTE